MEFIIRKRQSIVVYLSNLKQSRQLKKFGNVYYISKRMKYVVMYIDKMQTQRIVEIIKKLHYIKSVLVSPHDEIIEELRNFDNVSDNKTVE